MGFRNQHALLKALQRHDLRALEAVIEQYGGYVMAVALHTLGSSGSREDAEEVTSDTFVALWKNAAKLVPDSTLKPWLAVVARNTSLKRLRSFRPSVSLEGHQVLAALAEVGEGAPALSPSLSPSLAPGLAPTLAEAADGTEEGPLDQALEGLSATDRDLLRRRYGDGEPVEAIAKETGLSTPAVKSRLYRSRKTLRSRLTWRGTLKESRG
ncbi:MAG: sigma-70 family RNA polymerase sigma factor [Coriobacteriales bacterium]|jgi:RNA polymerase sigma-70 factor (ECF subfamily)|nr:sigma-70 family RNA polymerase sigma factor [Coriobacteriales bacterium]